MTRAAANAKNAAEDIESILELADDAILALQHAIGGMGGAGIDDDVEPTLERTAKTLRELRGCALNAQHNVRALNRDGGKEAAE